MTFDQVSLIFSGTVFSAVQEDTWECAGSHTAGGRGTWFEELPASWVLKPGMLNALPIKKLSHLRGPQSPH